MSEILQLLFGLVILLIGGEFLVRGSITFAKFLKVSPLVIGLTVVSFGTSAPELLVSLQAALNGSPDLAIGNVIGSNIANITLQSFYDASFDPYYLYPSFSLNVLKKAFNKDKISSKIQFQSD